MSPVTPGARAGPTPRRYCQRKVRSAIKKPARLQAVSTQSSDQQTPNYQVQPFGEAFVREERSGKHPHRQLDKIQTTVGRLGVVDARSEDQAEAGQQEVDVLAPGFGVA